MLLLRIVPANVASTCTYSQCQPRTSQREGQCQYLSALRPVVHGALGFAAQLVREVEVVLLLRRLEHGVAAAHEQEAGVAQVGGVQLALVGQAPQDARRRGALDLDPTSMTVDAATSSAAVGRVSGGSRATFRKR